MASYERFINLWASTNPEINLHPSLARAKQINCLPPLWHRRREIINNKQSGSSSFTLRDNRGSRIMFANHEEGKDAAWVFLEAMVAQRGERLVVPASLLVEEEPKRKGARLRRVWRWVKNLRYRKLEEAVHAALSGQYVEAGGRTRVLPGGDAHRQIRG